MNEELKKQILKDYQEGKYSIVDIARIHRVEVDDVLNLTGNTDVSNVTFVGDMIDESEIQGTNAVINRQGATYKQTFTKN